MAKVKRKTPRRMMKCLSGPSIQKPLRKSERFLWRDVVERVGTHFIRDYATIHLKHEAAHQR